MCLHEIIDVGVEFLGGEAIASKGMPGTPSVSKYLSPLIFFYNFDHLSYSKIAQVQFFLFAV
jgi:hypothetical protein